MECPARIVKSISFRHTWLRARVIFAVKRMNGWRPHTAADHLPATGIPAAATVMKNPWKAPICRHLVGIFRNRVHSRTDPILGQTGTAAARLDTLEF